MELSVIILAYDEVSNLSPVVREIHGTLVSLARAFELVIVDDGSSDGTGPLADALALELASTRVVHHEKNLGLGGVYRTGFSTARGELVTFFPADGQFPATIIAQFLPLMAELDMVLGFLPDRRSSVVAKTLSWLERVVYRFLFGPMPRFQGVFMFRRELLARMELRSTGRGWAIVMELIIRTTRLGVRTRSVPTEMRPRLSGTSKVNNFRTIWSNTKQAFALRKIL